MEAEYIEGAPTPVRLWAGCFYFHLPVSLGTPGAGITFSSCCLWNPEDQNLGLQQVGPLAAVAAVCWWLFSAWAHTPQQDASGKQTGH